MRKAGKVGNDKERRKDEDHEAQNGGAQESHTLAPCENRLSRPQLVYDCNKDRLPYNFRTSSAHYITHV